MRKKLLLCALVCALAALLCGGALAEICRAQLQAPARIYAGPSGDSELLAECKKDIDVSLIAYANGWAKVSYRGRSAYVRGSELVLEGRVKAYTSRSSLVYRQASGSAELARLEPGSTVYVAGFSGARCQIENASGSVRGYIDPECLSTSRPKADEARASSLPAGLRSAVTGLSGDPGLRERVEYMVYLCDSLVGTPYASPDHPTESFDNSGFVEYCLGKAGFSVGSSARSQGHDDSMEKIRSITDLRRGDVVCFNTKPGNDEPCDHSGIYIGDGYFIHASSAAGKVQVSTLQSGHYCDCFSWGRRPA